MCQELVMKTVVQLREKQHTYATESEETKPKKHGTKQTKQHFILLINVKICTSTLGER